MHPSYGETCVLEFSNHRGEPMRHGPFTQVRFHSTELFGDPGASRIAKHMDQLWRTECDGKDFQRFDCACNVHLRFESGEARSRDLGPFKNLSALDGVLYVGNRIVASYDGEKDDWYSYDLGDHWTDMVFEPVPAP